VGAGVGLLVGDFKQLTVASPASGVRTSMPVIDAYLLISAVTSAGLLAAPPLRIPAAMPATSCKVESKVTWLERRLVYYIIKGRI
jgi:hypothetical protein